MADNKSSDNSTGDLYSKRSEAVIVRDIIAHIGRLQSEDY